LLLLWEETCVRLPLKINVASEPKHPEEVTKGMGMEVVLMGVEDISALKLAGIFRSVRFYLGILALGKRD